MFEIYFKSQYLSSLIKKTSKHKGLTFVLLITASFAFSQANQIRGWNILSKSKTDGLEVINAAKEYHINHLQLSHDVIMNLRDVKNSKRLQLAKDFTNAAHEAGVKEVVLWDHALYDLNYYPDQFKTGPGKTLNLDNPAFWEWFKQDYREMLNLIPEADGLVLTFIETGARAEDQFSEKLKSNAEKLAAVVNAVAEVVMEERKKALYIRTFAYTDDEYETTIGCINHLKNKNIILMMKETPHDFFLTHPNDRYAGTINRPTIIEFDTGNEFNGQGIIANTWPEYVLHRWKDFMQRKNIIGYVARSGRFGNTRIVGRPSEILLYALQRSTENPSITTKKIYNEFITKKYGAKALPCIRKAFKKAFDIVTSSLYTLGTNTANHSNLNYDPYISSYGRHVSGKWINPPVVKVKHGINKKYHYWTDIINHIAPARLKTDDGPLKVEAPLVLKNDWVQPIELMDETYLKNIITEKRYGLRLAEEALAEVEKAKKFLTPAAYEQLYGTFYRTVLTCKLHSSIAQSYFGYRVYTRGELYRKPEIKKLIVEGLKETKMIVEEMNAYKTEEFRGEWTWIGDTKIAMQYYDKITQGNWPEYGNVAVPIE